MRRAALRLSPLSPERRAIRFNPGAPYHRALSLPLLMWRCADLLEAISRGAWRPCFFLSAWGHGREPAQAQPLQRPLRQWLPICGRNSMAEFQPSKLAMWVQFPSLAPKTSEAGAKPRRKENRRISSVARAAIGAARAEKLGAVAERSMATDSKSDRGDDVVPEKPSPSRVQTPPAPPVSPKQILGRKS